MTAIDLSPLLGPPGAYVGIGSRETPPDVLDVMTRAARWLAARGWTLRSGAAPGADSAFEKGALDGGSIDKIDLFLPYPRFQKRHHDEPQVVLLRPELTAYDIAQRYHPWWYSMKPGSRALHARNAHQILGVWCRPQDASKFVLCWSPDGADGLTMRTTLGGRFVPGDEPSTNPDTGGTGQAIRIAAAYRVPVYNLQRPEVREAIEALIGGGR